MKRTRRDWEWAALEKRVLTIPHVTQQEHQALQQCERLLRESQNERSVSILIGFGIAAIIAFFPFVILRRPWSAFPEPVVLMSGLVVGCLVVWAVERIGFRRRRLERDERMRRLRENNDYQSAIRKLGDMQSASRWLSEYDYLVTLLSDPPAALIGDVRRLIPNRPPRKQQAL